MTTRSEQSMWPGRELFEPIGNVTGRTSQFGSKAPDWWLAAYAWPPEGKPNGFDLALDLFMDMVDGYAPGGIRSRSKLLAGRQSSL